MQRPMTRHKGRERFRRQSKAMTYNMSTRAGQLAGYAWQAMRADVHAQAGWPGKLLERERRMYDAANYGDSWAQWLLKRRAELETRGHKFLAPAR